MSLLKIDARRRSYAIMQKKRNMKRRWKGHFSKRKKVKKKALENILIFFCGYLAEEINAHQEEEWLKKRTSHCGLTPKNAFSFSLTRASLTRSPIHTLTQTGVLCVWFKEMCVSTSKGETGNDLAAENRKSPSKGLQVSGFYFQDMREARWKERKWGNEKKKKRKKNEVS